MTEVTDRERARRVCHYEWHAVCDQEGEACEWCKDIAAAIAEARAEAYAAAWDEFKSGDAVETAEARAREQEALANQAGIDCEVQYQRALKAEAEVARLREALGNILLTVRGARGRLSGALDHGVAEDWAKAIQDVDKPLAQIVHDIALLKIGGRDGTG